MPVAHRDAVVVLLVFFKLVARFSHVNKMNARNVAVCFAPSIFKARPSDTGGASKAGDELAL